MYNLSTFVISLWNFNYFAQEKLETAVRSTTYPEMIEKITAAIKEGSSVVLIMPISVFLLSLNDATMPPFFGSVLPPAWTEFAPFRIFLSIVEMYISGFAWVANVQLFHLIICQAFFIAFWIGELKLGREKDTQVLKNLTLNKYVKVIYLQISMLARIYVAFPPHLILPFQRRVSLRLHIIIVQNGFSKPVLTNGFGRPGWPK